jgi:hypothetical protein
MASLTGSTISSSYEQLLTLPDGGGDSTNLVPITDGDGGTTFAIQLSSNAVYVSGTLTIGVEGTGQDVTFYSETTGAHMLYDASEDALHIMDDGKLLIGTAGDLKLYHNGSHSYITNTTGNLEIARENSGVAVNIGHTTSETTIGDNLTITGTLVGTRLAVTNLANDGSIPITATCVNIDANGSARTGIRFGGTGTAGQMIIVNNTGGEKLTFHGTEGTALVRGIHADHDVMEANGVYIFVSDGSLWNYIGGGVDSQPDLGMVAS